MLENLERSLELMKQLAIEQQMDLLVEMAENILEDQKEINDNVESAQDSSALADQESSQQSNQDQFESLKEQFEQLKNMDQEMGLVPEENKSDMEESLDNPEIPEDFKAKAKIARFLEYRGFVSEQIRHFLRNGE